MVTKFLFNFFNSGKFKEFLVSYAGKKATSRKPAFYILLFLSLGTLFTDFNGTPNQFNVWILVALSSLIVSIVYFLLMGSIINKWLLEVKKWRVVTITLLFFTTEMFRAVYVGLFELNLGITSQIDWDYRIVAGGLTGILFFGIFSIFNNDSTNYKNKLIELKDKERKLRTSSKVTSDDLQKIRNDAESAIRKEINQSVQIALSESKKIGADVQILADELMRISEEVVRPISHSIFEDGLEISTPLNEKEIKLSSTQLPEKASLNPFFPKALTFFAFIQIVGLALFGVENKLLGIYSLITYSVWIYFVLLLAEKILKPRLPKLNLGLRVILISLVYSILALCPFVFDYVAEVFEIQQNLNFAIYLSAIAIIMIWPITLYIAIRDARVAVIDEITEANEKLSWSTARLGAQLWAEKQKFAHLIHKNVQGTLIAAALKLKNNLDSGIDSEHATAEIKKLFEDSVSLATDDGSGKTSDEYINYLNNIWDGVFSLQMSIDPATKNKLSNDPIAENSLNDLITEFATNSVKHGKSTLGKVEPKLLSNNVLEVTMQNNGSNFPVQMKHGMGSKMALEQCISISQKNLVPQGVEFTFTLPIK